LAATLRLTGIPVPISDSTGVLVSVAMVGLFDVLPLQNRERRFYESIL
jgi:hypothetical protein